MHIWPTTTPQAPPQPRHPSPLSWAALRAWGGRPASVLSTWWPRTKRWKQCSTRSSRELERSWVPSVMKYAERIEEWRLRGNDYFRNCPRLSCFHWFEFCCMQPYLPTLIPSESKASKPACTSSRDAILSGLMPTSPSMKQTPPRKISSKYACWRSISRLRLIL